MNALDMSKQQVLKTMTDGGIVLAHATAARMVAVHTLTPASRDPVRHLQEAHAQARTHLVRLTVHDPSHEIPSFMTNELFSWLTDAQPRPLTPLAGVGRYTYTPRKALRRVLDHALDHLNQIDQWLVWQRDGVVPTPTDGWVGSSVTLPGDLLPLSSSDLDAWLWRVDQAVRLVQQRAHELTEAELDWQPPDGGWPLRRVLHHLARSERLYAASIDEALPGEQRHLLARPEGDNGARIPSGELAARDRVLRRADHRDLARRRKVEVEPAERPAERSRRPRDHRRHEAEDGDRPPLELVVAVQAREPQEHEREHRVA